MSRSYLHGTTDSPLWAEFPLIVRAREYRLYGRDGRRYIDFFQDGGRALLGHRPPGWTRSIKSTASRGLFAPYRTPYQEKARRLLLAHYPWAADGGFYNHYLASPCAKMPIADPLFTKEEDLRSGACVILLRPFGLDSPQLEALMAGEWGRWVMPLLPIPGRSGPIAILDLDGEEQETSRTILSPIAEDITIKALSQVKTFIDNPREQGWKSFDLPGIERRGPYLLFEEQRTGDTQAYALLFRKMLAEGILIPPEPGLPLIIPGEFHRGEVEPLVREIRRRHAER